MHRREAGLANDHRTAWGAVGGLRRFPLAQASIGAYSVHICMRGPVRRANAADAPYPSGDTMNRVRNTMFGLAVLSALAFGARQVAAAPPLDAGAARVCSSTRC